MEVPFLSFLLSLKKIKEKITAYKQTEFDFVLTRLIHISV
jgi:hypothetical protein